MANIGTLMAHLGVDTSDLKRAERDMKSSTSTMERGLNSLKNVAMGLFAGFSIVEVTKQIFETGMEVQRLQNAFNAINGTAEAAQIELDYVREITNKLGQEFYSTADAYRSFSAAATTSTLSLQQQHDIFTSVIEASTALGLSNERTQRTLYALEQMVSKGTVSMEELRQQLGDQLPGAFQLAAQAMGKNTQEFAKMVENGEILADDLLPKLALALHEKYANAAVDASDSAIAAWNRAKTAFIDLKAAIGDSGVMDFLTARVKELTLTMEGLVIVMREVGLIEKTTAELRSERIVQLQKELLIHDEIRRNERATGEVRLFHHNLFIDKEKELADLMKKSKASIDDVGDSVKDTGSKMDSAADDAKELAKRQREAKKAAEDHAKALESVLKKYLPMESAVADMNEEQALLNELFNNGVLVGDRYTEAMGNFTVATKEAAFAQAGLTAAIMDTGYEIGVELPEQWDDGMDLIAKNAQEYSTKIPSEWEKGNEEIIKLQEDLVNDLGRIMEGFVSDILTGEIDSIEDLFKGLFDSVLDMFARMIAQMAANSIIDAIFGSGASGGLGLGSLFGLIGEFFGGGSSSGGSGTGTATSLFGMLGTAYEWLTGTSISGTIGGYFGLGGQAVIAPYMAGSGQMLGGGGAYIGGNMAVPTVAPTTTTAASSTTAASIAPYAAGAAWVAAAAWAAYSHFEHKQQPTTADFYNQMGLRPEDFASLIGDEFKLANIPLFGDVLSKWDQTSNSLIMLADAEEYRLRREYTGSANAVRGWSMAQMTWDENAPTWIDSQSLDSFYETLQRFSDFTHTGVPQSLDEYAEALRKLGYSFDDSTIQGIWEWGQATMTSTERIQMSFEDLGLSGAQLRIATELLNNAYLTAEGTTKELEEYLLGLGYTTEEVSEVLSEFEGNFIEQMKRMGEEAMPPLMKAMADQVNSYTKLSATMNLASVQANSLNANYDSLAGGIDEFGNTLNDFSNSIGDVNMAVDEAANSLVTIADNTLESIYGILDGAEGLVGAGTVPQPAPGPTPTEPTSPAPTPVTGPTAGNIQVNVMIDGKQLDARTEIIADRLIVARENRPNVKGRRVLL